MRYPSIDTLLDTISSKYSLVLIAAKRGRSIEQNVPLLIENPRSVKPVGIALEEILAGKLKKS